MTKNIAISGVLGGTVMFAVTLACRLFLPGVASTEFRTMPGQAQIHAALKERIVEPGTYICPYLPPNERSTLFPDYLNEPIFAVTYSGYTHDTVPGFASVGMLSFLLAPMAAAWLLSQASANVLLSYSRKLLFIVILGLFIAVSADLLRALTEDLPIRRVAGMAVVSLITWTLIGLVLAWRIRPMQAAKRQDHEEE